MKEPAPPIRWFDTLGSCQCGKSATGTLRGPRNESYGLSCTKRATARLKKADKRRHAEILAERIATEGLPR